MPDHAHILDSLNPDISISDMVQDVKRASTNFINDHHLINTHFNWQKGFGAFSYSKNKYPMLLIIYSDRRSIIGKKHSGRNTLFFSIYLALNTMKNIYSNFMINIKGWGMPNF